MTTLQMAILQKAFNKVKDLDDWRNPIEAVINRCDLELVEKAIEFFQNAKVLVLDGDATFDAAIFKYKRDDASKYVTVFTDGRV